MQITPLYTPNEKSKLLLALNCSPKELEKTVVNSCGIEHPATKRGVSDHSIELYYVDHVEPAPIYVTTTAAVKAETVSQTRIVQFIELVFIWLCQQGLEGKECSPAEWETFSVQVKVRVSK